MLIAPGGRPPGRGLCEVGVRSDEEEMRRVSEGGERAFVELFGRYWRPVLSFLFRLCGDLGEAEDLAQGAFLRLLEHRDRFDPARSFRTWIFTIARRLAYNRLQKSGPEPREGAAGSLESDAGDPARLAVRKEEAGAAREALARLPLVQREVLLLRAVEGLSYGEIAEIVGANESTVRSRMDAAARAMRRLLA
jgi:RNA polymerase sigma-70 factor (ECF subfamily)